MKYLTPEIESFTKSMHTESLVRPTISCGIFQEYDNIKATKVESSTKDK